MKAPGILFVFLLAMVARVTFNRRPLSRTAWLYSPCNSNSDCSVSGAHCRRGKCICKSNYYYHNQDRRCIETCPMSEWGQSFLSYPGSKIQQHNATWLENLSLPQCQKHCLRSMSCIAFQTQVISYGRIRCSMLGDTAGRHGVSWTNDQRGWTIYQRTCNGNSSHFRVEFKASLSVDTEYGSGDTIIYDNVLIGDPAYDPTTGIFTAPRAAIYGFRIVSTSPGPGNFGNAIMKLEELLGCSAVGRYPPFTQIKACHIYFNLTAGRSLSVRSGYKVYSYLHSTYSSFYGVSTQYLVNWAETRHRRF